MYEVSPSILEARLLGSGNQILDAAVVGIANQENGQVYCNTKTYSFKLLCISYITLEPCHKCKYKCKKIKVV